MTSLRASLRSSQSLNELEEFVFGFYWGEDEYVFEPETVELIFAVLSPYLETRNASPDTTLIRRLANLYLELHKEFSPESAIASLEKDRLTELITRLDEKRIRAHLFWASVRELSSAPLDWEHVVALARARG